MRLPQFLRNAIGVDLILPITPDLMAVVGARANDTCGPLRAAARHNLSQSFTAMWMLLATTAEVMDLTLCSDDDFDSLTRTEKARVWFHMMLFKRTYENAYFH